MSELLKDLMKIVEEMEPLDLENPTKRDSIRFAEWTTKLVGKVYEKGYKDGLKRSNPNV